MAERPWRAWLGGAIVVLLAMMVGAAAALAWRATGATEQATAEPPQVNEKVRRGTVTDAILAEIRFEPEQVVSVEQAGVVTGASPTQGAQLNEGDVLWAVNEQATLIGQGAFPLYRDLHLGASGQDVAQVKAMLRRLGMSPSDGNTLDARTASALMKLFQERKFPLRAEGGETLNEQNFVLHRSRILFAASTPVRLAKGCGQVGSVVSEPCTVRTSAVKPHVVIPATSAGKLPANAVVRADVEGKAQQWQLGGPIPTSKEGEVRFALSANELQGEQTIPAKIVVRESAEGFVVPAAAVRKARGADAAVELTEGHKVVAVQIELCAAGECAVRSKELREGQEVVVS